MRAVVLLSLLWCLCDGGVLDNEIYESDAPVPPLPTAYGVAGTLNIPYAEISEPFFAWLDLQAGCSRIDYYGGMVKTYQLSDEGEFGRIYKLAPITTEEVLNKPSCFLVDGAKEAPVKPQGVLPDLSGFQPAGEEVVHGQTCMKWRLVQKDGGKVNTYTFWAKPIGEGSDVVPVKYEMRGYNSLLGSHYDHYYLDYDYFDSGRPSPVVFQVPKNVTCGDFPGPGIDHMARFNPMMEYVHGYDDHVEKGFDNFKHAHSKSYEGPREDEMRKSVFRHNLRFINSVNRARRGYQLGVNHLADRTDVELRALRGRQATTGYNGGLPFPHVDLEATQIPPSIDWRLFGAVTPVKDQSVCGSCWSFGTTGTIEGAHFLKTGQLVRLSQQALIDCSWGFGNNGCDGGEDFRSYQWMMKHKGLPSEDSYGAYLGADGYCHVANVTMTAKIHGYVNVTSGDASALKVAIAKHGPISVGIDASHKSLSFYSNGIYYEPKCKNKPDDLDHAVLAVGYGELYGQAYWLVKNSWSTYWGNDGYVLMAQKDNNCGVTTEPTYVLM